MSKLRYKSKALTPIHYFMVKNNLKKSDICRILNISEPTLSAWIENPGLIQIKNLYMLAGLFNIRIEVLIYLLTRNKPSNNHQTKEHWLSEEIDTEISKFKKNTDIN